MNNKRIYNLNIRNFLGRGDININLNPDVNIFAGANGSGKSALLTVLNRLYSNTKYDNINMIPDHIDAQNKILDLKQEAKDKLIASDAGICRFDIGKLADTPNHKLSKGELRLLSILLTAYSQHFNGYGILLIDEPELSLHIEWQKSLIRYIKAINPNLQIIIATHSPNIIVDGWMDKIFYMDDIITKM